jgi:hypothetical protein
MLLVVIPAQAGIQNVYHWRNTFKPFRKLLITASAGMTSLIFYQN